MNYRLTIGLVAALVLVIVIGVIVTTQRGRSTPERASIPRTFFYQVDDDDINKVIITHLGTTFRWVTDSERTWRFDDVDGEKVNLERWSGITLLLSGPQYRRKLAEQAPADKLAEWGLASPRTVITVGLQGIGDVTIRIGDKTPDGISHYTQFRSPGDRSQADSSVYLIDSSWGDVMERLVNEPPYLPTPTPEATPEEEGMPEASDEGDGAATATPEGTPEATPEKQGTPEASDEGDGAATATPEGTPEATPEEEGTPEASEDAEGEAAPTPDEAGGAEPEQTPS